MADFWVVAPCRLVEVYRRFRAACCHHHHGIALWNAGLLVSDYMALQLRTQSYSSGLSLKFRCDVSYSLGWCLAYVRRTNFVFIKLQWPILRIKVNKMAGEEAGMQKIKKLKKWDNLADLETDRIEILKCFFLRFDDVEWIHMTHDRDW
jgi:hypothetical protein